MLARFDELWNSPVSPFQTPALRERAHRLALSLLACLGRRTITGWLCAGGRQQQDWSSDYRFFSKARWPVRALFTPVLAGILQRLEENPLVVAMDDTQLPKTGKKIPGVGFLRNPMSPPFNTNLHRAQRMCQISAMLPDSKTNGLARAIPVRFEYVPPAKKPGRKASEKERQEYRRRARQEAVTVRGAEILAELRSTLDTVHDAADKTLVATVDGSFCNSNILRRLPHNSVLIGRIRHDAKLHHPVVQQPARGRRRLYGEQAPTPDQLFRDESIPWQKVTAFAGGKMRRFSVKRITPLLWRSAGVHVPMQLVVVKPVGYRRSKGDRTNYRRPSYLICTDPTLAVTTVLQYYIWRWDIETNHRDEKQIIGVGQAQVRSPKAVDRVPAFAVAVYATLLLAHSTLPYETSKRIAPLPKWRRNRPPLRVPTNQMIRDFRSEIWSYAMDAHPPNFDGFVSAVDRKQSRRNPNLAVTDALLHAHR